MRTLRNPDRIAASVFSVVVLCLVACAIGVAVIRNRTNDQAEAQSFQLVIDRLEKMQDSLSRTASDYNNWTGAYTALMAQDVAWMSANYGVSGVESGVFDGAVLFGGTLPEPWAWSEAHLTEEPSPTFLAQPLLDRVRTEVSEQRLGERETFNAFTIVADQLTLLSATRTQPYEEELFVGLDPATLPIAVLTETLDAEELAEIAKAFSFSSLSFGPEPALAAVSLPIRGLDGQTVGYLSWMPNRPGDQLVTGMLPVLLSLAGLVATLGLAASWLSRSYGRHLIQESERASQLARTDHMTRLPNRLAFSEHLTRLENEALPNAAVIFLDLNGFKSVNDAIGHDAGDALVVAVAKRVASCIDQSVFFARLGGDEFVLVLSDIDNVTLRVNVLTKLIAQVMSEPFSIMGTCLPISVSQGAAVREAPDVTMKELVRRADLAMYRAKQDRLTDAQFYTPELDGPVRRDRELETSLRAALSRPEEFSILYQPIVSSSERGFERAEALARWHSPDHGAVPPNVFIGLAERTGLMIRLGQILLDRICADLVRCRGLRVCINISPVQLRDPTFLAYLDDKIARYGLRPEQIEFELTESVMIDRLDQARVQLEALQARGFTIALDDFGTGFSSIGYLTRLPFNTLKIDQVFLTKGDELTKNLALIRSIIHLAHTLGKLVVCEGVETKAQADALADSGCDQLQGYHFARPMPITELVAAFPAKLELVA